MPNCPLCNESISEGQTRCPACGVELDLEAPGMTIPPPGSVQPLSKKPEPKVERSSRLPLDSPRRPPSVQPPLSKLDSLDNPPPTPPTSRVRKPRPKPPLGDTPLRQQSAAPPSGHFSPAAPASAPALQQPPASVHREFAPPYQVGYAGPPPVEQGGAEDVGGLRGWLIKKLGGQNPPGPSVPGQPPNAVPGSVQNLHAPAIPHSGSGPYPAYAYAPPPIPPAAGFGAPIPPAVPHPPTGQDPGLGQFAPQSEDGENKTELWRGPDVRQLKFPTADYRIQLLDANGVWNNWCEVPAGGRNIGRSQNSSNFPFLSSMAVRHVKLSYDGPRLKAEDLGSLNGTYLRITAPVELHDGMRFRVGSQVMEFQRAEPNAPVQPERAADGEEFLSYDLEPLAYLTLIRPDNTPGVRFPIIKTGITRIGSDETKVDLALTRAEWVSRQHAQIRPEGGHFFLEDTNSRNGTFLRLRGPTHLNSGDVLIVGRVVLRVVDGASGM